MSTMNLENLKNQKVGILGLGEENFALAKYFLKQGIKFIICDRSSKEELGERYEKLKNLAEEFRLGPGYLDSLKDFEVVFRTPSLPYLDAKIQEAKTAGVKISSEIKYFFHSCPCAILGVTGTKGKGTTASLIAEILKKALAKNIYLAGNIGTPPIEFLDKLRPEDVIVLELSSFQLQDLDQSPHIAVILDVKVDHLDYHKDEQEYIQAKTNIVKYQSKNDFAVINADYLTSIEFAAMTPAEIYWFSRRKSVDQGAWIKSDEEIILREKDEDISICKTSEVFLRGKHNLENICAAIAAGRICGADIKSIKKQVKNFKGLEHRLEFVRDLNGIKFYNDSYSTTPDTTIAAIHSFSEPIILLLGGSEKNADYSKLAEVISESPVKKIINIGLTGQKIIDLIKNPSIEIVREIKTIDEAVALATKSAKPGNIILLSPASASFDCFKNYKQRGDLFKQEVISIKI